MAYSPLADSPLMDSPLAPSIRTGGGGEREGSIVNLVEERPSEKLVDGFVIATTAISTYILESLIPTAATA
jgi:hypothetical protein